MYSFAGLHSLIFSLLVCPLVLYLYLFHQFGNVFDCCQRGPWTRKNCANTPTLNVSVLAHGIAVQAFCTCQSHPQQKEDRQDGCARYPGYPREPEKNNAPELPGKHPLPTKKLVIYYKLSTINSA